MLLIVIGAVVGTILGVLLTKDGEFPLLIICAIIGGIIAFACGEERALPERETELYKLAALQDASGTTGHWLLGCGYIQGELSYAYYVNNHGTYSLKRVAAEKALIRYTDSDYRVVHLATVPAGQAHLFSFDNITNAHEDKLIFYIPVNSIKQDYTLDAK